MKSTWLMRTMALWLIMVSIGTAQNSSDTSINEVINSMTINEKVNLVLGTGMNFPGLSEEMMGPDIEPVAERVLGAAGNTFPIPRLGIPSIVLADGPAGLRIQPKRPNDDNTYYCTAFPIATLLASTWDEELVEEVGKAVGSELKEYGVDILLAPAQNIHRIPLGGRNFEYYSEDPLISGKMAAAMVKGVQSQGVGATLKHFFANNHEWNRYTINVKANERSLREIYLKGFEIAVKESNPWAIMTSYNKVNGTYTSENGELLTNILRNEWNYDGVVMTDWFGGRDAVAQMVAGNELLMPGTKVQQDQLLQAVNDGKLKESVLDRNISKILNIVRKSPAYNNYAYSNKPDLIKHAELSRSAASEGIVLLKNEDNSLPLMVGDKIALYGNNSYQMVIGGTGSGDVNEAYSVSLVEGMKMAGFVLNTELEGMYNEYIVTEENNRPSLINPFVLPEPVKERRVTSGEIRRIAKATDVAVITIGRNSGEFKDRELENDYYLSEIEKDNIKQISKSFRNAGKKVVAVLNVGGLIEIASWRDMFDAILLVWQPGQEAGNAIADVLSGKVNPSGKLATTFPIDFYDIPSSKYFPGKTLLGPDPKNTSIMQADQAAEIEYNDGIWIGYRYFSTKRVEVAYPFGFGLSYTNFSYSDFLITDKKNNDELNISVTITNSGNVSGKEVVQLYISSPNSKLVKPKNELKAFAKTNLLEPGESEIITFKISLNDLSSFDQQLSAWVAESGEYTIKIGQSSTDIRDEIIFNNKENIIIEKVSRLLLPEEPVEEISIN